MLMQWLGGMALLAPLLAAQQFPSHTVDVTLDFNGGTSFSRWVNGYLPKYSYEPPTVWMLDRNGKAVVPETEVLFPDAKTVKIKAVTADSSGALYVSAEVWGMREATTGVICRFRADRKPALVIRTDDFVAISLAVSPDGDIWAFGIPILLQTSRKSTSDYDTLLHFSGSGRQIDSSLPRSEFGPDVIPTHFFGDIGSPWMWATKTRVGIFSPLAQRWVELDIATHRRAVDISIAPPVAQSGTRGAVANLAMTDSDNNVYAAFFYRGSDEQGTKLYLLDKTLRQWVPCRPDAMSSEFQLLSGADGDNLIFRSGSKTFGWFSPDGLKPGRK